MRRFSQRNALVTLSDINITPLLDLAFVLLIIFVITTPLLEQGIEMRLPEGGRVVQQVPRENIRLVEVDKTGRYLVNRREMDLNALEQYLVLEARGNPEMVVRIRADRDSLARHFVPVLDRLIHNGITRISLATEPSNNR